jgi:hypothetical protein
VDRTSNFPFEREARLRDYVAAIKLMVAVVCRLKCKVHRAAKSLGTLPAT